MIGVFSFAAAQTNIDKKTIGNGAVNSSNGAYRMVCTVRVGELPIAPEALSEGFNYQIFDAIGITTTAADLFTESTARSGGYVVSDGGFEITLRGVVWSATANPTLGTNELGHSEDGSGLGAFTSQLTGLSQSTLYHVRAYAINSEGINYANEVTFTTIPTLGEWGLIAFGGLIAVIGGVVVWRKIA